MNTAEKTETEIWDLSKEYIKESIDEEIDDIIKEDLNENKI
jgi:hypothetical protein